MKKTQGSLLFFTLLLSLLAAKPLPAQEFLIEEAEAPLFRDPIFDGAADPSVIWHAEREEWWIFYTQRRANVPAQGVSWCYGTDIGIAVSADQGRTFYYKGVCEGLDFEPGELTFWAPEVLRHEDTYHMFVTYIRGIWHNWGGDRHIIHLTSPDLFTWTYQSELPLTSDRVIDPGVIRIHDTVWRLWYKDEAAGSITRAADSRDLYSWQVIEESSASDRPHEAPNVFFLSDSWWLLTDTGQGMGVYASPDMNEWEPQPMLMREPGLRTDDGWFGQHPDVVVMHDRALMFYFVHAGRPLFDRPSFGYHSTQPYEWKRTVLQVAELEVLDGRLICNRNKYLKNQP